MILHIFFKLYFPTTDLPCYLVVIDVITADFIKQKYLKRRLISAA